jgi:hypothetical protein
VPQELRSIIVTCAPVADSRNAVARPMMPPPMMRVLLDFTIAEPRFN